MSCRLATSSQLISEQAAANPGCNRAWSLTTASWTYAELDRGAERIAAGLLAAGMPPGARVGVMLDRSAELIATVLGVLKAGAAVVPLDVSYPRARIDLMIDRARPFRVISDIAEVRALLRRTGDDDAAGDRPRECGLRVVHIWFDGRTQGRHDAAPGTRTTSSHGRTGARQAPSAVRRCSSSRCPSTCRFRKSSRRSAVAARCGWCPSRSARICGRWCALSPTRGSNAYF